MNAEQVSLTHYVLLPLSIQIPEHSRRRFLPHLEQNYHVHITQQALMQTS